MKITYHPTDINNFHGSDALTLRISGEIIGSNDEKTAMYVISGGQAKKIQKHFCGISDCHCPAGAAIQLDQDGVEWGIYTRYTD